MTNVRNVLHICAGWQKWNGAANIARMIMGEQEREGHRVSFRTWANIKELRAADEVWIHCSWMPCLWWAALWGRNVHWVPECSYDPIRRAYHGWKKTLVGSIERFCLRRANVLVATCEAEKEWIESYLGKHCPPIEVTDIKRFFDLSRVEEEKRRNVLTHNILYLGRRHPLKGVEYLEAAVAQLANLGKTGQTLNSQNGIELKVVSNAFGEEKEKIWKWCDVLVLPTLSDNFGLVIAEALERGKRVITTDGAPAWDPGVSGQELGVSVGYGGRLLYLNGYRDGTKEMRVELLRNAITALRSMCWV